MNSDQLLLEVQNRLAAATAHFQQETDKIRTGRAHPGMLEGLSVEVYGQTMPLKAVASISVPEAQLLQVTPFDPANLKAVSDAIRDNNSMDFNPADDGRVVRIQIPPLTEETRQQMVKILHQKAEEAMIVSRQARHDALRKAEAAEKAKSIGKDDLLRLEKQIDEKLSRNKSDIEAITQSKEREILTV